MNREMGQNLRPNNAADKTALPVSCPDEMALASYIDEMTTAEEKARIESHLAVCPDCRAAVSDTRILLTLPPIPLSEAALQRLEAVVARELEGNRQSMRAGVFARIERLRFRGPKALLYRAVAASFAICLATAALLWPMSGRGDKNHSTAHVNVLAAATVEAVASDDPGIPLENALALVRSRILLSGQNEPIVPSLETAGGGPETSPMDVTAVADRYVKDRRFSEALDAYSVIRVSSLEPEMPPLPKNGCCPQRADFLRMVYLPVSEARCYLGLKQYDQAKDRLRVAAGNLAGCARPLPPGAKCCPECACEACECLAAEVCNMLALCENRTAPGDL